MVVLNAAKMYGDSDDVGCFEAHWNDNSAQRDIKDVCENICHLV